VAVVVRSLLVGFVTQLGVLVLIVPVLADRDEMRFLRMLVRCRLVLMRVSMLVPMRVRVLMGMRVHQIPVPVWMLVGVHVLMGVLVAVHVAVLLVVLMVVGHR